MYVRNKEGRYGHIGANIQKTIKVNEEVYRIINECSGRSFSDKIRKMAYEYEEMKLKENDRKVSGKR